jgi:hypothetical protein
MAQLTNVNPGDLIKAADFNALLALVQGLSAASPTGQIAVPNLFGLTLGNAVAILALPSTQLTQGQVLDTLGNKVSATASGSSALLVLNQSPSAGSYTIAGASINMVVSPAAGSTAPTPKIPTISGFKPSPVAINAQVEIDGLNFDPLPQNNQVSFAGVAANPPSGSSNPVQLFVIVPSGIPGAPTTTGQTLSVNVLVTTPAGSANGTLTISPPLTTPLPTIQSFNPTQGTVGASVSIVGTGFSATPSANAVMFDNVSATPTSASTTQLSVVVPSGINGLSTVPSFRNVPITVEVAGQVSPAVSYGISNLTA